MNESDIFNIEIHQNINNQHRSNAVPDILYINKQKQTNQNEPTTSENGNTTQPNNAQPNNPKQTLSQDQ